jgi:PEP-CTERM motif-containing protein
MDINFKHKQFSFLLAVGLIVANVSVQSAPLLQVGASDGAGGYVDYTTNSSNPTETDTAIITGSSILFAGISDGLLKLGGKYGTTGVNYSTAGPNANSARSIFDGQDGAIAFVSVAQGFGQSVFDNLTLGGMSAFAWEDTAEQLFPNSHAPVKDAIADFVFFNIGNFSGTTLIPDFADETIGNKKGEIKTLALAGILPTFEWLHFDVVALATDTQGQTNLRTTFENNPGSHDVTWKSNNFCANNPLDPSCTSGQPVPEPEALWLIGAGLLGFARFYGRKSKSA